MTRAKRSRRPTVEWYWIEGLRKLGSVRTWVPLYCARDEQSARTTMRIIQYQLQNRETLSDIQLREVRAMGKVREFRVVPEGVTVRCNSCSSNWLKRVKRDDQKLWKCLNCKNVWPRGNASPVTKPVKPSKAPVKPSKARKQAEGGTHTPKRSSKAQNPVQKPVPKRKSSKSR